MARSFATVCCLLVAHPVWAGMARAPDPVIGVDGCAVLAAVVYAEVTEARLGSPAGYGSNLLFAGQHEFALCQQTTRSVTGAYTAALRRANIHVTWGYHAGYRGDYCLSYFLSQCYPAADPAMPPWSNDERSFVAHSWQAVRDAVHDRMVLNPGSDVARFRRDALHRSIRQSMQLGRFEDRPRALRQ